LELEWLESENWSEREISLRGQLPPSIKISNVAIIGCGTLGATIAELLVRAGVHKIHLIDNEIVKVGNLARHILATSDIGRSKSEAVANRLNNINPHARVTYSNHSFFLQDDGNSSVDINKADIILDCTGEDSVLATLSALKYRKKCRIISISIGLEANRVYVNMQNALSFQYDRFFNVILKYLIQDEAIAKEMELPRDGIGCWHPTFPARADDVFAAATLALKAIDGYISSEESKEITLVFKKDTQYGFFVGYKIIEKVEHE
jgi:molybdopterin/thiamine biosynthesis adenylyltransferase